ncbi:TniQ family protein [Hydrogenophaga sp.]|uniref:TniQ family protein n=1 Tax=Hydrogenophaga sp. TaxID=1904254 RepID=UPI00345A625A
MSGVRQIQRPCRLPFVDAWLEDESLYSWCSRHHRLTPHVTRSTGMALFGVPSAAKSKYTIANLPYFEKVTDGRLGTSHEILRTRTPMGAYMSLIERSSNWRESGRLPFSRWAGMKIGALCSLRYCEACHRQHRSMFGTGLWRMAHQLPGVAVCGEHFVGLREVTHHGQTWVLPGDCPDTGLHVTKSRELEVLTGVATAATLIFQSAHLDVEFLKVRATAVLCDVYGAIDAKHLDPVRVQKDWESSNLAGWLNREAPRLICCARGWILDMLRGRSSVSNPMRWALLAGYLKELGFAAPDTLFSPPEELAGQMDFWDDIEQIPPKVVQAFVCSGSCIEVAHRLGVAAITVRRWKRRRPALALLCKSWTRASSTPPAQIVKALETPGDRSQMSCISPASPT